MMTRMAFAILLGAALGGVSLAGALHPLQARQLEYCNAYNAAKAKGDRARASTMLIFYKEVTAQLSHTQYPSVCKIP